MPVTHTSRRSPGIGTPRRWLVFLVGFCALITGIAMTIGAELGVGSWQVFETGLVSLTGASFGTVVFVEAVVAAVIAWVWLKEPPWIATAILAMAGNGIGFMLEVIGSPEGMAARVALFVVGMGLIAIGVAFYLAADLGASAQDALFVGYYTRYRVRPGVVRFVMDAGLVVAGILLGGQFGVGTFVVTVAVPLMIEPALRLGHGLAGTPLPAAMSGSDESVLAG